jgi:glycosyltransferase involved in cell wall biosynthesis
MEPMAKLFVSHAISQERLAITPPELGADSWGWKKLSFLYKASFAAFGYQITSVVRPEIYQSDAARKILGIGPGDWHLAVKPIEHLRPFHGLPNVFVCDWPFPELASGPCGDSPFYDQARLLGMADAVICCTEFTTHTLRHAGIERVITLPPIILPQARESGAASLRSGQGRFLSVVDNGHLGRQLGPVIEGFFQAARQENGLRLTICLQGGDARSLSELRQQVAQSGAASALGLEETISVIGLEGVAAAPLFDAADFFLCADAAPGLCVPLVEAMLAGLPLVTTMTAGTASFLTPEAEVPIATGPQALAVDDDEPIARFLPLTANPPTAETVRDAVLTAAALDEGARTRLADTGREIAERRFGRAAFKAGLGQLGAFIALETA